MMITHLPIDRLISMYAVRPVKRIFQWKIQSSLSILMYHSISEADEREVHPYYRLCTPPALFECHLLYLRENGYRVLTLENAVRELTNNTLQGKNVVITFDDGFMDSYEEAFPLLLQYGVTATMFLPVNYIGDRSIHLNGRKHLTWHEVSEMAGAGITFGSHTMTHRKLSQLSLKEIETEISCSKSIIEDRLGIPSRTFSYPYAFPENEEEQVTFLRECLRQNRYLCGVTTVIGHALSTQDRFFLPRLPINSTDDLDFFSVKLDGYYDWLHGVQYAFKKHKESVLT